MARPCDRDLGMERRITRRDFLNGVSLALTGSILAPGQILALPGASPQSDPAYYPPALTGLRGSHPGSFETAHRLRDGEVWEDLGPGADTGESYDLVVVGGGISGLSAAHFFRKQAGPKARILILDNHDDFGGHAKRNEFRYRGRLLLMNGGTLNVEAPSQYSRVAKELLRDIGFDTARYYAVSRDKDPYETLKLSRGLFFDKETFGEDRLVAGYGEDPWPEFLARTPLSRKAREDIARLYNDEANPDYMPGLSSQQKKARLSRMSYRDFLLGPAGVHPDALPLFQRGLHGLFCVGNDAIPALFCWEMGFPGFQGMDLEPTPRENLIDEPGGQHGRENRARAEEGDPTIYLPDGNATLARLLVRALIPEAIPGSSMEDVVTARADYSRLDSARSAARIRLNSTAVRARHTGKPEAGREVEITYVRAGKAETVRAGSCVLACWNSMIPALCPELPERQKKALAYAIKTPIVYTNVLIRNWTSFQKLGVRSVTAPGSYHGSLSLANARSLGEYRRSLSPEEPNIVQLYRTPCAPGLPKREQHRVGRTELLSTTFEMFERKIRDQLGRTLSGGGYDPARDSEAITVNRWPHGYATTYNTLYEPVEWALDTPADRPCVIARQPHGRIAIANADAAASPHSDAAINEAYRAVRELSGSVKG